MKNDYGQSLMIRGCDIANDPIVLIINRHWLFSASYIFDLEIH